MTKVTDLKEIAESTQEYVVGIRRDLHKIPEIRFEEEKTLEYIIKEVEETKERSQGRITYKNLEGGLVVDYTVQAGLPWVLFRADIDALPMEHGEKTGLPFSSTHPEKMHACGHDTHTAMLLGAMRAIIAHDIAVTRNIRFVFQRAEENPDLKRDSGGLTLVKEGVLEGIDEAFALHIWAKRESGTFFSKPGRMFANSGRIVCMIKCTGGHVAMPQHGSNAIDIANDVCNYMKGVGPRLLGPSEPVSIVPAIFKAGSSGNIRPSEVELWFSSRTFLDKEAKESFNNDLERAIKQIVAVYPDASVDITFIPGHAASANSQSSYDKAVALLKEAGEKTKLMAEPELGGEDFAYYLEYQNGVPGAMLMLGADQAGSGDHHSPTFNPDESVFWRGVHFWLLLATQK